jgi:RNA-directed DNA polymerase
VLANLFMHYAFDVWLAREFPLVTFERYADDAVIHCVSKHQARKVLAALHERMAGVGLELHPDKTKIVYCKDSIRRSSHEHTSFTFLGFTFRPRQARRKDGVQFTSFLPAISKEALKKISAEVRSWRLHRHMELTSADIARWINPKSRGWMTYYGAFCRSELYPLLRRVNAYLMRWLMNKYKRYRTWKKAIRAWTGVAATWPRYFAHWAWVKPARQMTRTARAV